jgi:Na+-transporting NADH:ubiquinone oxidoreductase subunit NqrC
MGATKDTEEMTMRFTSMISVAASVLMLGLAAPTCAQEKPDSFARIEQLLDPKILLQGVVREEDVSLLFAHLKAALLASYQGRDAPAPEELNRRMEAISAELKSRGALAGLLMLTVFEAAARQALREGLAHPAPTAR